MLARILGLWLLLTTVYSLAVSPFGGTPAGTLGGLPVACAGSRLTAEYPYSMTPREGEGQVTAGGTAPLFVTVQHFDVPHECPVTVRVELPQGLEALLAKGWQVDGQTATAQWVLPADFGNNFDLLYLRAGADTPPGRYAVRVQVAGDGVQESAEVPFSVVAAAAGTSAPAVAAKQAEVEPPAAEAETAQQAENKPPENNEERFQRLQKGKGKQKAMAAGFNWYIQGVTLPTDVNGKRDERAAEGVVYVRDTTLEGLRNRLAEGTATSWSAVFNHPATFMVLDLRNPQKDVRVLKFRAELTDKDSHQVVAGLATAGKVSEDEEQGWAGDTETQDASTALISLNGNKTQTVVLPLYVDYFKVLAGEYNLRVTVEGGGARKVTEVPLTIAKKPQSAMVALAVSFASLLLVVLAAPRLKRVVFALGARGAITVALFAAIAFGGIVLPMNVLGDLLHALLGPFSGLISGLLSGLLQYLLLVALLVLFRRPGVAALFYFVKFMLTGLMFGHFTPLALLSCCTTMVMTELALHLCGFYRRDALSTRYMLFIALALGVADALNTWVNLQQMMFFYRLYYADWYLALYMLVNGLCYSSLGSYLGFRTGRRLEQVLGE